VTYDDTKLNVFSSGTSTAEFNWLVMYTKDEEKLPIHTGETRFYGNCVELKIPHKCEKLPDFVYIIPTENPENNLGEFYFKYDDTYIYVYNTGDATTKFRWFAYNKSEEDASLNLTRYFTANNNPTVIKHGVDTNIPYIVSVIPDLTSAEITDIDCTVGEVSVKVDETSIYVYNTGSYSGKFKLLMVNPESMISLEKYLKYEPNGDHNVNGYFDKGYHEPTGTQRLNYSGKFSSTVLKATQDGHAEYFTVITPDDDADQSGIFDGAIVGIDSSSVSYDDVTNKLKLVKCGTGDNYIPVGIVNSDAGVLYGHEADNRYPVSFDGIVKIKIAEDESTGKYVNISDYLYGFGTLSDVKSDKTIGYALSERDTTNNVLALIIHNL
jgi:hypothetical protein